MEITLLKKEEIPEAARLYIELVSRDEVLDYFHKTHEQFMQMVEAMPEEEMLERGLYTFIGKGAVYNWLGAYAAHDAWGKKKIREWMKARGK